MALKNASIALLLLVLAAGVGTFLLVNEVQQGGALSLIANAHIDGLIREPLLLSVRLPDGSSALLDAFVTRPEKPGRWPVALITHGTNGDSSDRTKSPNLFSSAATVFARHGYAAVVVMRQGYGQSSGFSEKRDGTCLSPHHARAGRIAADDLIAALQAIQRASWSLPDEAVLIGVSSGGFSVLAAGASNPPGIRAIINFDGGRGAKGDGNVCGKEQLLTAIKTYGSLSRLPTLWMYATNDKVFPLPLGEEFFASYIDHGGRGEFFQAPAFGEDGHTFFEWAPEEIWWGRVADFLDKNRLPSDEIISAPVPDLEPPEGLATSGKASFQKYLNSQVYEKAFATNGAGVWAWSGGHRSQDQAGKKALTRCEKMTLAKKGLPCTVYAVGNTLVNAQRK
ncbi:dienelactone hydrolase family protein [Pseudomonas syringae group sp. J248-6]|uniref:dienelactone hydrolase family protein n=1 Tax=Pseudomonas syringae group sp. J248-6 TaxID=3079590 RepID=UPI00290DF97E|nr:CocE/NonD family hydrolase [Pseudomonas syringae group sp. J248-6]MDU8540960.1 CocE/NonD family hydrolase [Pseudomonas syringae group sp. J248-6]